MAVVEVFDERRTPVREVGKFTNVPDQWTLAMILERFGIAEHLGVRVTREFPHGGDQVFYRHPAVTNITTYR